ncbi:hypothetical protein PT277_04475 [Acetobacteraceae bacterium ESL0709]|nr:hypothetical protein [Acetobacteraceae bacterium ESL0697]MDF7677952.1 hypothetical protein [Acetobacteraceae bacterium ESL0709]
MTSTVTVLCRLVSDITLQLSESDILHQDAPSPAPVIRSVMLNGARTDRRFTPEHHNLTHCTGSTQVSATFWKTWLKQHKNTILIKKRLIFAESKADQTERSIAELGSKVA